MWNNITRFMQEGGTFMYIILIVFIIGLAITIERFVFLTRVKSRNKVVWQQILPMLQQGNFAKAEEVTQSANADIGRILAYGMDQSNQGKRHDDIELAMEEGLMEIIPQLEKRTPYLATFANIATLLGLLGTIMGLISAFTAVANVDPAEKANLLSASISVAMNTTAFGLMAAIPLLLAFSFLQTKTTEIVDSLEMVSVKFINLLRKRQIQLEKMKKNAAAKSQEKA
ncbi:MAG: flagellar motor protein MotA [Gammaproteobacteria bacterium CG22_combo_CG10-13_8_21_14_all_40_8]|nr:MAG: flagellar motor protein MotA [Gammaproteobacteria bacterium CG22_combo_CG10-13_8_21_14_all_40_8]